MDWTSASSQNRNWNRNRNRKQTKIADAAQRAFERKTLSKILRTQGALSNPLILKKILGFLGNTEDLLICRAVCSDWKFLATEILLERKCVTIPLIYEDEKEDGVYFKLRRDPWGYNKKYSLKNLLSIIKSADSDLTLASAPCGFPCVSFKIRVGDPEASDISSFFHLYGRRIEKLELDVVGYGGKREKSCRCTDFSCGWKRVNLSYAKTDTVRGILCRQLPNLRELKIGNVNLRHEISPQEFFSFEHLFQEFQVESKSTTTGTALSPGKKQPEQMKTMMTIARLANLHKLFVNMDQYHELHDPDFRTDDPRNPVLIDRMLGSESLEFYRVNYGHMRCRDCVRALISSNQVKTMAILDMTCLGFDLVERIIHECPAQLNFKHLQIDFNLQRVLDSPWMKRRLIRVLNTVFKSMLRRSKTKMYVQLNQPTGFLSDFDVDFEIPVLENVSTLRLQNIPDEQREDRPEMPLEQINPDQDQLANANLNLADIDIQFFPSGFSLSHSFPNLQTVELNNWDRNISSAFWGPDCQSLPTVKSLDVRMPYFAGQEFSVSGFSKLVEIFPKLAEITIQSFSNFPAVTHCLWKFKELEKLTIGLRVGSSAPLNLNSNDMGAIDAAITGFTIETCQKLRKSEEYHQWATKAAEFWTKMTTAERKKWKSAQRDQNKQEQKKLIKREKSPLKLPEWLSSLRVNPSICDLPKLKKLEIDFCGSDDSLEKSYPLISELSGLCAFRLMPQLQVEIHAEKSLRKSAALFTHEPIHNK